MKHENLLTRAIFVASLMVLPLILPMGSSAAPLEKGSRALQKEGLKQNAVESVQDTLKACLGRIPQDASIGQLMLAKENCQNVATGRAEQFLTF